MRLKKGMTLIAIGFLFISFSIKFNLKGSVLTLPPEFVGWILFTLAYPKIVNYTSYNVALYWIPLVMAFFTGINWMLGLLNIVLVLPLLMLVAGILVIVYLVKLLGCLELFARDYARNLVPRVHTLKVLYLCLQIAQIVLTVLAVIVFFFQLFWILDLIAILAAAVVSIVICVTLFQLRSALPDEDPALAGNGQSGDSFGSTGTN